MHKPDNTKEKKHIFIIGSKGIPASYGGYETFLEKLTEYKSDDRICYHVACRSDHTGHFIHNGAKCFNVKVPPIGSAGAIWYDVAALRHAIKACKKSGVRPVIYILACRIGPFIGHYKKIIRKMGGILYINPDGHEWKRSKWSAPVRLYWKISEGLMVKHADLLICDSKGIESYIQEEYSNYHPKTTYISYGAECQVSYSEKAEDGYQHWCEEHDIKPGNYYLIVGRFVPENNYESMIREYLRSGSEKDLVIITTENPKFSAELEKKLNYSQNPGVKFVGSVYDQ